MRMPQRFTSWEAIYTSLRSHFPDDRYHSGHDLTLEAQSAAGVSIAVDDDRIDAGLLIAADGIRSRFRAALAPDTITRYAGYVAWRGVVDEADLDPELVDHFDDFDAETKVAAVGLSQSLGDPALHAVIRAGLADPDTEVSTFAADAAYMLGLDSSQATSPITL